MDLVDEQHRADARALVDLGLGDDLAQVGHAGGDGGQRDHARAGFGGQQTRERGLTAPGRPPQHDAGQVAGLRQLAQDVDHPLLSDEILEPLRPHPGGQGKAGRSACGRGEQLALVGHQIEFWAPRIQFRGWP